VIYRKFSKLLKAGFIAAFFKGTESASTVSEKSWSSISK